MKNEKMINRDKTLAIIFMGCLPFLKVVIEFLLLKSGVNPRMTEQTLSIPLTGAIIANILALIIGFAIFKMITKVPKISEQHWLASLFMPFIIALVSAIFALSTCYSIISASSVLLIDICVFNIMTLSIVALIGWISIVPFTTNITSDKRMKLEMI